MIGVIANPAERSVVCEFFELFKTPWEFFRSDRQYDVLLLTTGDIIDRGVAKLVLVYSGQSTPFDAGHEIRIAAQRKSTTVLAHKGIQIPIYGDSITFQEGQSEILVDEGSRLPAIHLRRDHGIVLGRIGYGLFDEIAVLLTDGQPIANASVPTLDLHIALLRDLIVESGVPLVEIPPVPDGHRFIACLTHDVDHPSIRAHKCDHTMFGFLYRAIFGSMVDVLHGRSTMRKLRTNWQAALKLLLVHLGLAKDYWRTFNQYLKIENGLPSSFFVIPFKNYPGRTTQGLAPSHRASRYGALDIADDLRMLISSGNEIAAHGIDAWLDSSSGQKELKEIRQVTGAQEIGIRMHWLYFNQQSPSTLEKAGFNYDSTVGYNQAVGYRAGTSQVYKPLDTSNLLELPLHIMDTSLLYPGRMNLTVAEAKERVGVIIDNAVQSGGAVTVNWHDRSIAPERLWGDFYVDLVEELKNRGAWFSTASQAVAWFRKRRAAVFENVSWESDGLHVKTSVDMAENLPGLRLRIYNAPEPHQIKAHVHDLCLKESMDVFAALSTANGVTESSPSQLLS